MEKGAQTRIGLTRHRYNKNVEFYLFLIKFKPLATSLYPQFRIRRYFLCSKGIVEHQKVGNQTWRSNRYQESWHFPDVFQIYRMPVVIAQVL